MLGAHKDMENTNNMSQSTLHNLRSLENKNESKQFLKNHIRLGKLKYLKPPKVF